MANPMTLDDLRAVSPALAHYTVGPLLGEVWKRAGLGPRDRSIATLATMIARNQSIELGIHVNLALDNGVAPAEVSEIITHLAFYAGWANATMAVRVTKDVFADRKISADQLPPAEPELLPIAPEAEAKRAATVQDSVGPVAAVQLIPPN
jgi:4-carboxymuconolactone decarboxylase